MGFGRVPLRCFFGSLLKLIRVAILIGLLRYSVSLFWQVYLSLLYSVIFSLGFRCAVLSATHIEKVASHPCGIESGVAEELNKKERWD